MRLTQSLQLVLLGALVTLGAPTGRLNAAPPVKVIFDTDVCFDVDDAGAVAVLHALADRGECEILAMGVSIKNRMCAPCLDAMNTYYGRPSIPIGDLKGPGVPGEGNQDSKYVDGIAKEFPHDLASGDDAPDVVKLYREVLAKQGDHEVVLITVGFITNVANLLASPPDKISPLSGHDLVQKKVRRWVCMGGAFKDGHEYNLMLDPKASKAGIEHFPRPIVFSGFEIGEPILTGPGLKATPEKNPIRRSYELYNNLQPRSSWDQTAVLYAVRGDAPGGLKDVWELSPPGETTIDIADGRNHWKADPKGRHTYLIRKLPNEEVAKLIEALMVEPPAAKK